MASEPAPPPPVIGSKSGSLTVSIPLPPAEAALQSLGPESPGSEFSTPPTSPRAEDSPDSPTSPRAVDSLYPPTRPHEEDSPQPPTSPRGVDSPEPPTPEQPAATSPHVSTASLPNLSDDAVSMPPQAGTASRRHQPDDTVSTPRQVMTPSPSTVPDDTVSTPPQARTASPSSLPPDGTVSTPPLIRTVSPPLPQAKFAQLPPVQVPPPQYEKASAGTDGSALTFFWDAVARVQEAHASLDEYISKWFGLDQSKYQWALNDYYERTGQEMDSANVRNPKEKV